MAVVEVMGKLERGWLKRDKENDGLSRSRESVEAWMKRKNRGTGGKDFFFLLLWVLQKVSKREFWRKEEVETKSNEGGFICLRLPRGKFFTVKYPLIFAFLSFATVEACWMLWHGHQRPIYLLLILGMGVMSCILSFYWFFLLFGLNYTMFMFHFHLIFFLDWFELCSSFTSHAFDFHLKSNWFQPPVQACWSKHETGFYSMTCSFTLSPPSLLDFFCSLFVFGTHFSWEY